ncbi:MAG: pyrroloquinoline quinone-dependent dehydrogenase, partial [Acidobacteria bacterium]|nr:pyrroloquinoline quinone-dependent dehydrogenase [Acidobacteriota bacterium]
MPIDRRSFLKLASLPLAAAKSFDRSKEWNHYGGDAAATRYSLSKQITPANVKKLRVAWTHKTGDASQRPATNIEATPIVVDGVMYLITARNSVQAIDAAGAKLLWTFHPGGDRGPARRAPGVNRGVCYWEEGGDKR